MARVNRQLFATDESRSTVILVSGSVSLLAALAAAAAVWQAWGDIGVVMGPNRTLAITVCEILGTLLAVSTGIWAVVLVNRLTGRNALKCVLGYFLDAVALAIIGACVLIVFYLGSKPG